MVINNNKKKTRKGIKTKEEKKKNSLNERVTHLNANGPQYMIISSFISFVMFVFRISYIV